MAAKSTRNRKVKRYGWVPDLPDHRDVLYAAPAKAILNLPAQVDLRSKCPSEVYDQGQLGSCTANAIAGAIEFDLLQSNPKTAFTPSRLFIYYNERVIEGTVDSDSGAQLRDGIKTVAKQGGPPETLWPYDISKFEDKPSANVYKVAAKTKIILYHSLLQNLNQMKGCLVEGYPFVYGFTAYESFESPAVAKTGIVPMPSSSESVVGGHAVLAVGYDDNERRFIVRNSWGPGWGMKGYFTVPYSYLTDPNLANDFWTIRMVK